MEEEQLSIEGDTLELPQPFMVIATQNPIEMSGTYELPEAQRDRFQLKLTVDIPDRAAEREIIDRFNDAPALGPDEIEQVVAPDELREAQQAVADVHVGDAVKDYITDIVEATRSHSDIAHGGSPRASLSFLNTAKARAAINGRDYVILDDIKTVAEPILVHRIVLNTEADLSSVTPREVVESVLKSVTPPSGAQGRQLMLLIPLRNHQLVMANSPELRQPILIRHPRPTRPND